MLLPRIGTSAEPLPQQRAPAPTPEPVKSDETWSSTAWIPVMGRQFNELRTTQGCFAFMQAQGLQARSGLRMIGNPRSVGPQQINASASQLTKDQCPVQSTGNHPSQRLKPESSQSRRTAGCTTQGWRKTISLDEPLATTSFLGQSPGKPEEPQAL